MRSWREQTAVIVGALFMACLFPRTAHAVVPPDFIFNIGSQVAQFFSVILLGLGVVFGGVYRSLRLWLLALGIHRWFMVLGILGLLAVTVVSTFAYRAYRQKQEYAKWLAQTQVDGTVVPPATPELDTDGDGLSDRAEVEQYGTNPHHPDTDGDGYTDGTEVLHGYSPTVAAAGAVQPATQQGSDSNNQLAFETAAVVSLPKQPFASSIEASPDDKVALLVEKYYGYIARHQLAAAYELSSHEVSLPTFESWLRHLT
jgi:hypothetical protein